MRGLNTDSKEGRGIERGSVGGTKKERERERYLKKYIVYDDFVKRKC